jgi:hypothetical protein
MPRIEAVSNWLADLDWTWWPLLSLRPAKDESITHRVVARATAFFGPVAALLVAALLWLVGERRVGVLLSCSVPMVLVFYVVMRGVTARYWNRRAARLRGKRARYVVAVT